MTEAIAIKINADAVSPRCLGLALDPEARTVWSFSADGTSVPEVVWRGKHIRIPVNRDAVPESVAELLSRPVLQDILIGLCEGRRDRDVAIDALSDVLAMAKTYMDAGDWIADARREIVSQMREALASGAEPDEVVEDQVGDIMASEPEDGALVRDEVEREIRKLLPDALETA